MPRVRLLDFLVVLALSIVLWVGQHRLQPPRWITTKPWRAP